MYRVTRHYRLLALIGSVFLVNAASAQVSSELRPAGLSTPYAPASMPSAAPLVPALLPPPVAEPTPLETPPIAPPMKPIAPTMPVTPSALAALAATEQPTAKQAPQVAIETVGPAVIQVGKPLSYEILVKNIGTVPVTAARVEEELPAGVRVQKTEPSAEVVGSRLVWMIGELAVGAEQRFRVTIVPAVEGEFRNRASLTFTASSSRKVKVQQPRLSVKVAGTGPITLGEEAVFRLALTNTGSGPAEQVLLRVQLSDGLKHPQGNLMEAEVGNIQPGETRTVTLKASTVKGGPQSCLLTASIVDLPGETQAKGEILVNEPKIALKVVGPARCLVRSEPTYTLHLSNPGTAPTAPVVVTTKLPEGFEFVSASDDGRWDSVTKIVSWNVASQPGGAGKSVTLKLRAVQPIECILKTNVQAGPRLDDKAETPVKIEGVPALRFEVVDLEDPIEVGKETTYEIRILNQGTCACTDLRVEVHLSEGLTATSITAPIAHKTHGQMISFEPYPKLAMKADAVIRLRIKGMLPGDQRCRVQVTCNEITRPIIKEESTRFYKE